MYSTTVEIKCQENFNSLRLDINSVYRLSRSLNVSIDTLERQEIRDYYNRKWYPESLYLLAMLDYLSRVNDIPICDE